jgi:RNA-binding S4 domain protein
MRIDKYLWCIRVYKTRNIATEACKKGHIKINGEVAKASKEVFVQDKLTIRKDQINYEIVVNDIPESRVGAKLVNLYRIDNTPPEAFEHAELQKLAQDYYRKKGEGRPTKKDRRELDQWFFPENDSLSENNEE